MKVRKVRKVRNKVRTVKSCAFKHLRHLADFADFVFYFPLCTRKKLEKSNKNILYTGVGGTESAKSAKSATRFLWWVR